MRLLLVLVLVHGLAPELAEVGEALVHYVRTGHAAHTPADHGDLGDQGPEHCCGGARHQCACCASQAIAPTSGLVVDSLDGPTWKPVAPIARSVAAREPDRPFRPPIA